MRGHHNCHDCLPACPAGRLPRLDITQRKKKKALDTSRTERERKFVAVSGPGKKKEEERKFFMQKEERRITGENVISLRGKCEKRVFFLPLGIV